jgi:hypothetical protein
VAIAPLDDRRRSLAVGLGLRFGLLLRALGGFGLRLPGGLLLRAFGGFGLRSSCCFLRAPFRLYLQLTLTLLLGLDLKLTPTQSPLPETADELCAVARDLKVAESDIYYLVQNIAYTLCTKKRTGLGAGCA